MTTEDIGKWDAMLSAPTPGDYDSFDDDDFTTGASVITAEGSVF
jgi:hypothetical protein